MSKVAVVTDTNSGMSPEEAEKLGIFLLPMPFTVDGKEYFEGVNCTYEHFFEMLAGGSDVSTSQPSPESITGLWDKLLEDHDAVVHIPMSSALSGSCGTAKALAADYGGKVEVADNKRISLSQRRSAIDALKLAEKGMSALEIRQKLEEMSYSASIYLAVNTLELLKKSGRVTKAGAAIAAVLNLKPVLQIQGEKLDAFSKARGMANAEKVMLAAAEKDRTERFAGKKILIEAAYSGDLEPALEWQKTVQKNFKGYNVVLHKLPVSISCHVGAGVKAIGCMEYVE